MRRLPPFAVFAVLACFSCPTFLLAAGIADYRIVIDGGQNAARVYDGDIPISQRTLPKPGLYDACGRFAQVWRGGGQYGYVTCDRGRFAAFDGRYAYGVEPRPGAGQPPARSRAFGAEDLALVDLGLGGFAPAQQTANEGAAAVATAPFDPAFDQWRLLVDKDGGLDTNPAPLISTAQLLRGKLSGARADPAPAADAAAPLVIRILGASRTAAVADHQRLLNRIGYFAGAEDGVLGPETRTAIARFEVGLGMAPTGRLTGRISDLIHRAAGVKAKPAVGELTIRSADGRLVESASVEFTDAPDTGAMHVLVLAGQDGAQSWKLLTLAEKHAASVREVFGVSAADQVRSALAAVKRVRMSDELKARLGELAGPGTLLVIGGQEPKA